jgi:hypothetical protein
MIQKIWKYLLLILHSNLKMTLSCVQVTTEGLELIIGFIELLQNVTTAHSLLSLP